MATVAPNRCPSCGAERPADAPRGHCPRCLLRAGFDSGSLTLTRTGELGAAVDLGDPPGVLETLAASVGPVPRVLLRDTDPGSEPPLVRPPDRGAADPAVRYRIDGEIARGGMGAVLKGRDPDLGRDVAVKVLREDLRDRPELVKRFVEEAQIGGQLQHPGIVPVYELGTFADRRPFFSMKLVKGRTLAELLAERPAGGDLPRFLSIFEAIAQTVAYAHARGVIHRDLKPSNVMVGSFGEVQVMDWGLAKVLPRGGVADDDRAGRVSEQETLIATARSGGGPDAELSRAGSAMGTPSYMAPEQARGEVGLVDERADVFALGSILCEVLTGQPAFTGSGSAEILRKATRSDMAEALGRLDVCGADAELVALARDCLAAEPVGRPRDAGTVSARITAYLSGVQERLRAAEIDRARAEATAAEERRRRRLQLGLAASLLALLTLGGVGFAYELNRRQAAAARADRLLAEARLLRDQAVAQREDVARWERARDALGRIGEDVGGSAAAVAELRREVEAGQTAAEADRDLLARLVDIRSALADDPDGSATDAAYADAFAAAGVDPDRVDPAGAGAVVARRPKPVAAALVAAMDDWAAVRRARSAKGAGWIRVLAAARAADPDPDRAALRDALLVEDRSERLKRLRPLAGRADAGSWAQTSLGLLGSALAGAGDLDAGIAVLRRAAWSHPEDAQIHYALGRLLQGARPPQAEEAIRAYSVAWARQPELGGHDLAHALEGRGRGAEAEAVWRDLVDRRPGNGRHLGCYGRHLKERGRGAEAGVVLAQAIAVYREEVRRKPDDAAVHNNLGNALRESGDLLGAIEADREAIRLEPDGALHHYNLGIALRESGDLRGAMAEYREAIRLKPDLATAHTNLGVALLASGDVGGAIVACREAIRLEPDLAPAHSVLGFALRQSGDLSGAIAEYREAIRLKPDDVEAHTNLGYALNDSGDVREAIAELDQALRLKPDYAEVHCNLGQILGREGRYAESLAEFRRGHELGSKRPAWPYPSAEWVAEAERLAAGAERPAAQAGRLSAILAGKDRPADAAERLAFAQMAYDTKRYAAAARLLSEALAADPKLGDDRQAGHRYNAACAAALAAAGRAEGEPPPDAAAKAGLRRQALDWLRAELAAWSKVLDSRDPKARSAIAAILQHWKQDPDLAGVRDGAALAALPQAERDNWKALWAEVDRLLDRAAKDR